MSPRLAFALEAAYRAGKFTLSLFQAGTEVERKPDGSPVTLADRGAERLIREMISAQYPDEEILGEEEGGVLHATGWVIDPIDGTKSFVCGVPLYANLLSFEQEGEPVIAVCNFPALNELIYATKGGGAYWNGRACRVSHFSKVEEATLSCGSHHSMAEHGRDEAFLTLARRAKASRTWTDAYGHALVATGRIEAMVDPIVAPWDISAMRLIVREAGGAFTDFAGGQDPRTEALASNGHLHSQLLEAFAG